MIDAEKINDWVKSKVKDDFSCPVCGGHSFNAQKIMAATPVYDGGNSSGRNMRLAMLMCTNCWYVLFFNPKEMELE